MQPVIKLENVSKKFFLQYDQPRSLQEKIVTFFDRKRYQRDRRDSFWVLNDINFEVYPGETLALVGSNGSGKSTLLKLLTQIIRPTTGKIEVYGRVSALLELGTGFHPDLTGRENIYLNGAILGISHTKLNSIIDEIIEFSELGEFIDVPVRNYSSGMYVRLGFAVAVYVEPEILIVDEVLAVGDITFQQKCMDRIHTLRREGVTILLVTHDLSTVQTLCKRAIWINKGEQMLDDRSDIVVQKYTWYMYEQASEHEHQLQAQRDAGAKSPDSKATEAESTEIDSNRWGSGEIVIEGVHLRDKEHKIRDFFRTGETLNVELEYNAPKTVENPVFGLAIHKSDGTHITGPNTQFAGKNLGLVRGAGVINYQVASLPLLPGSYMISVAVCDEDGGLMYDYHNQMYHFRVIPAGLEQYGLVTLGGDWSWHNGSGSSHAETT